MSYHYIISKECITEIVNLANQFQKFLSVCKFKVQVEKKPEKKKEKTECSTKKVPDWYMTTVQFEKIYKFICYKSIKKLLEETDVDVVKFDRAKKNLYFDPVKLIFYFENGFFKNHLNLMKKYDMLKHVHEPLIKIRKTLTLK